MVQTVGGIGGVLKKEGGVGMTKAQAIMLLVTCAISFGTFIGVLILLHKIEELFERLK